MKRLLLLAAFLVLTASLHAGDFKVGEAEVDITPAPGTEGSGERLVEEALKLLKDLAGTQRTPP